MPTGNCKGCNSYRTTFGSYNVEEYCVMLVLRKEMKSIPNCPCPTCLIKSICQYNYCPEFLKNLEDLGLFVAHDYSIKL
jgi:hypothetical protein